MGGMEGSSSSNGSATVIGRVRLEPDSGGDGSLCGDRSDTTETDGSSELVGSGPSYRVSRYVQASLALFGGFLLHLTLGNVYSFGERVL